MNYRARAIIGIISCVCTLPPNAAKAGNIEEQRKIGSDMVRLLGCENIESELELMRSTYKFKENRLQEEMDKVTSYEALPTKEKNRLDALHENYTDYAQRIVGAEDAYQKKCNK